MKDWLVAIRKKQGLSTYAVAAKAGIGQSYYSAIENDVRGTPPNIRVAKAIAGALGFDWTRFYE